MKKSLVIAIASAASLTAAADVFKINEPVKLDGKFEEPCWAKAKWEGDFRKFENCVANRKVEAKTEFAVLADERNVYLGVKCYEPDMARIRAAGPQSLWTGETVEFFFAPSGVDFDFYHFGVGFNPESGVYSSFSSEGGVIQPDPYKPDWQVVRGEFDGGWSVEAVIPLSSFYMNRNTRWTDEWLVNVCRLRYQKEATSWSLLSRGFVEPKRFKKMKGFPMRRKADDVAMLNLTAAMTGREKDKIVGTASMKIIVADAGEYELSSENLTTTKLNLKAGENRVKVPCNFEKNARYEVPLALKRIATGETYRRSHSAIVDFREVRFKLTTPQYRNNFYPGQSADVVKGRVDIALKGAVKLVIEGEGFAKQEVTLPEGGGEFTFDTKGFKVGTDAYLTATVGDAGRSGIAPYRLKVRNLAPTGHRMAWIENGHLVVDGKPVLRRNIYAEGYMGGKAMKEIYDAERASGRLYLTPEVSGGGTLEPDRVIRGLERSEAIRDVMPCKEYFEKIDAMIEKAKNKDFVYYYITDEPECRGLSPVYLRYIYEHVKELDPYHPMLTASRSDLRYIDCADWFETHPYLDPHDDGKGNRKYSTEPAAMGGFLDAFQPAEHPDKCVGFLPTLFSYKNSYLNDYPTFEEYVWHTWAAMIHGGKSLFPYAYHDMRDRPSMYEGNRYIFSSFAALENLVLDAKRTWLVKNDKVKAVRYDLPDESMFVIVNLTCEKQTVTIPELKGAFKEFRGEREWKTGWLFNREMKPFELKAREVIVATTRPHGTELPTYAETKALVDKLEAERLGRDNQLLMAGPSIALSGSKPTSTGTCVELFDGTRDVIAWSDEFKNESYIEIAFPKAAKSFHVVRVFGSWKNDPVISIRKDGEWRDLTPEKVLEKTKYSIAYDFGKPVRTIKMRVNFRRPTKKNDNQVELYEIEIGKDGAEAVKDDAVKVKKPENAILLFDEKNAQGSMKHGKEAKTWLVEPQKIEPREGGGFILHDHANLNGVRLTPDCKWFTTRLEKFTANKKGYLNWSVHSWTFKNFPFLCGGVTFPQAGLYTIPLPPIEKPASHNFTFYDYNFDLEFAYAAFEKEPADYLLCELVGADGTCSTVSGGKKVKTGDTLKVTLKLSEPAEEISASFMCDTGGGGGQHPYSVGGSNVIVMKRADADGRLWTAEVKVGQFNPMKHAVYVKVIALGGGLDLPIFTRAPSFAP